MRVLLNGNSSGYEETVSHDTINNCFSNPKAIRVSGSAVIQTNVYKSSVDELLHTALNSVEDPVTENPGSDVGRNDILKVESDLTNQRDIFNIRKYFNGNSTFLGSCDNYDGYLENNKNDSNYTLETNHETERRLIAGMDHPNEDIIDNILTGNNSINGCPLESTEIGYNKNGYSTLNHTDKYDDEENSNIFITTCNSDDSTCKRSYFVRGIINPNYPGFQHLAYTLTEHIISVPFTDSCDSDFSDGELEMEDVKQHRSETMSDHNLGTVQCKNNNFVESVGNEKIQRLTSPILISEPADEIGYKSLDAKTLDNNLCFPTPDILLKNSNSLDKNDNKPQNRPDLLQNVNPKLEKVSKKADIENEIRLENEFEKALTIEGLTSHEHGSSGNFVGKDCSTVGLSPVDIIGNFGQEVEREFGLLVNGYTSLIDGCIKEPYTKEHCSFVAEKMRCCDATLSNGIENMESKKLVNIIKKKTIKDQSLNDNISEYSKEEDPLDQIDDEYLLISDLAGEKNIAENNLQNKESKLLSRYKKNSYDERQLPPVGIDYKCNQSPKMRTTRKSKTNKGGNQKPNNSKCTFNNVLSQTKRSPQKRLSQMGNHKKSKADDMMEYHQLIGAERELILSESRYSKMAYWALHLNSSDDKDMEQSHSNDAKYNFNSKSSHIDLNHLAIEKDFERKRRFERDEIRKRLAFGVYDDNQLAPTVEQNTIQKGKLSSSLLLCEKFSDNESHSSDSETCPKLSKAIQKKNMDQAANIGLSFLYTSDDIECDFFTRQATLQLEARMALAQAKDMAHIQMEIDKHKLRTSPITDFIRSSVEKVGIQIPSTTRRVSRQMLTDMNITQLQVIVNDLHSHIEDLNDILVRYLTERDDHYLKQDTMLIDIEDLSRYLGAKEQSAKANPKTKMLA